MSPRVIVPGAGTGNHQGADHRVQAVGAGGTVYGAGNTVQGAGITV